MKSYIDYKFVMYGVNIYIEDIEIDIKILKFHNCVSIKTFGNLKIIDLFMIYR